MSLDTNSVLDLAECEREPICHLGLIQPHGHLLALNLDLQISHVSENIGQLFPITAREAPGRSLSYVVGPDSAQILTNVLRSLRPAQMHYEIWDGQAERHSLWAHLWNAHYILEWEPLTVSEPAQTDLMAKVLADGLNEIQSSRNIYSQVQRAADLIAKLLIYDRVMIYRFHPDWSGEVIAEVRKQRAEPYLGLRYPASDIPPQARKLYTETLQRVLVDVNSAPSSLLSSSKETAPLDLTHSYLRAMSPYHISYLRNLKVGATATASLLLPDSKFWGLIACHHDHRRLLAPGQRDALTQIARTLCSSIDRSETIARQVRTKRLDKCKDVFDRSITDLDNALSAILFGQERLRKLIHSAGTAVWTSSGAVRMGDAVSIQELDIYAKRLLEGDQDVMTLESRAELISNLGLAPENSALSGLVAIVVSRQPALILFGFRLQTVSEIIWGGDINKPVLRDEQTGLLSPRRSFAQFKQIITGRCAPWDENDRQSAQIVLEVLRNRISEPGQAQQMIDSGLAGLHTLATGKFTLQDSLLDAVGSGISLLYRSDGQNFTIRYANQTLLDLASAYSAEINSFPDAPALMDALGLPAYLLAQSDPSPQQISLPTAHEGLRYFLLERKLALEISDSKGTVSLSALLFTDTTRAERAREALQSAEARSKHLAFLKSSFLANMSHEIRTPMNGILGMTQMLQTTHLDEEQKNFLSVIQRSGEMMLKVINEILDISKIESGFVELENSAFDLTALVQGVADLMRPLAVEKGISLSVDIDSQRSASQPASWYSGDSFRLRQVMLNITGNAVKFTYTGGVQIRMITGNTPISIIISDSGVGIPEDQLAHVFDKFHQADPSTTRRHGGTGLGLAISRELVRLMGGTITLASTVGVGSIFNISLPLTPTEPPSRPESSFLPASKSSKPGIGRRILVAEDDLTNQIVIEAMLKTKGFEVDVAANGQFALDLLTDHTCDLILMDCQMPDLDGFETTARIRAKEGAQRHTPIIALTANALPEDRQRCLDAGMDDYLAKPIEMLALWEALRKWNCLPPVAVE